MGDFVRGGKPPKAVLIRHQKIAAKNLREAPRDDPLSGVNYKGASRSCIPDVGKGLTIQCDEKWVKKTFGSFYVRSELKGQNTFKPQAGAPLLWKKNALQDGFRPAWHPGGNPTAHRQNQMRLLDNIRRFDPDLFRRMSAWAARPGVALYSQTTDTHKVSIRLRVWEKREAGSARTTVDGNLTPAKLENDPAQWRELMARSLPRDTKNRKAALDEASKLWGPDAPHIACADADCLLEQRVGETGAWDLASNVAGAATMLLGESTLEVGVCVRAEFRCTKPPPMFQKSDPRRFSSKQDEQTWDEYVEEWKRRKRKLLSLGRMRPPSAGTDPASEWIRFMSNGIDDCQCPRGCSCGGGGAPGMVPNGWESSADSLETAR